MRKAFALAVDRPAIVARTVGQVNPTAKVLNNRLYLTSQKEYQDTSGGHYDRQDVAGARRLLESAGFTAGSDGIYAAADGARVSFELTISTGDNLRQSQAELIQAQVRQAGIEVTLGTVKPAEIPMKLTAVAGNASFKPFEVANVGQGLLFVSSTSLVFGTGGSTNVARYSNPTRRRALRPSSGRARRRQAHGPLPRHRPDPWEDMPRLPLYQRPDFIAFRPNIVNIAPSPALGPFWNTARWGLKA